MSSLLRAVLWLFPCGLAACTPPQATHPVPLMTQLPQIAVPPSVVPTAGQQFTGTMPFLDRHMTLPPGSWKVARSQAVGTRQVGLVGGIVTLVQADGAALQGLVIFSGNARPLPNGFALHAICTSTDVLWNDIRLAVPQGDQDCAAINFERPALWRSQPLTAPLMNQLDLLNVQPPNITVSLGVAEANRNWLFTETMIVNPDLEGITPDLSTQRAQSSWAAFRMQTDPAKRRLVEDLKRRAETLRVDLRRTIEAPAPYLPHSSLTPA